MAKPGNLRRSRRKAEAEGGHERWLVSYADMITLLFALFIVLYAMSKLNESKFQQLSHSLARAIENKDPEILPGTLPPEDMVQGKRIATGNTMNKTRVETKQVTKPSGDQVLLALARKLQEEMEHAHCPHAIHVHLEQSGLVIRLLEDRILFDLGEAVVRPEGQKMIRIAGGVLATCPNAVRVEGNTDNLPVRGGRFQSNWELSTMRATNVAEVLIRESGIAPPRVSVMGHGEYHPLVPNTSHRNRQINRHVDIVVLRQ